MPLSFFPTIDTPFMVHDLISSPMAWEKIINAAQPRINICSYVQRASSNLRDVPCSRRRSNVRGRQATPRRPTRTEKGWFEAPSLSNYCNGNYCTLTVRWIHCSFVDLQRNRHCNTSDVIIARAVHPTPQLASYVINLCTLRLQIKYAHFADGKQCPFGQYPSHR